MRVLVVDDNRALAENVAEILEIEGYETLVVDDPAEALRIARDTPFDAAVIDVRMPGMDGITLHAELSRIRPEATFVLMTAYARDERIEEAMQVVRQDDGTRVPLLTKPFATERLLEALRQPGGGPT